MMWGKNYSQYGVLIFCPLVAIIGYNEISSTEREILVYWLVKKYSGTGMVPKVTILMGNIRINLDLLKMILLSS